MKSHVFIWVCVWLRRPGMLTGPSSWQSNQSWKEQIIFPGRFAFQTQTVNDPPLVRSENWSTICLCSEACMCLTVSSASPLACTCYQYKRVMHEICAHACRVFYLQDVWALCHSKHPSPIDLTTSWESLTHTNTQILSEEHIERDLVLFQHDRKWELSNQKNILTWNL